MNPTIRKTLRDANRQIIRFAEGVIDGWEYAYLDGRCDHETFTARRDELHGVIDKCLAELAAADCGGCGGTGQRLIVSPPTNPGGSDWEADSIPCDCTNVRSQVIL